MARFRCLFNLKTQDGVTHAPGSIVELSEREQHVALSFRAVERVADDTPLSSPDTKSVLTEKQESPSISPVSEVPISPKTIKKDQNEAKKDIESSETVEKSAPEKAEESTSKADDAK